MGSKTRSSGSKKIDKIGMKVEKDEDGLPPWYLLQWSHSEQPQKLPTRMCSHFYLYSDLAKYGPDYEICVKYDFKSDNLKDLKVRILQRPSVQ